MTAMLVAAPICAFAACAVAAAADDARRLRIPNRLVGAVAVLFAVHAATALDGGTVIAALATGAAMLVAGFALFAMGWLGGGDAKLLAAAALWAGPTHIAALVTVTALSGGGLALLLRTPVAARLHTHWQRVDPEAAAPMPYGVAIACGMLVVAARLLGR